MADIKYLITVDASGATKEIKAFDETLGGLEQQSGKTGKSVMDMAKGVALGQLAFEAAKKAGTAFIGFMKDSVTAAMDSEKAEKSLAAALEITGRPVESLAEHFKEFATQMQKSTVFEDDAVIGAQTLLVQLTNLDKDGIDRATKGAIGLASVMGMDLESAAQLVAKSMMGNTAMLSRYGIQVDQTVSKEQQRAQILDKLEQFYGRATADTQTMSGQLAQMGNVYNSLQEQVGAYVTKNYALRDALKALTSGLDEWLTADEKKAKADAKQIEIENELLDVMYKSFRIGGATIEQAQQMVLVNAKNVYEADQMIKAGKAGIVVQSAYLAGLDQLAIKQRAATAATNADTKGTNKFVDEIKKGNKPLATWMDLLRDMPGLHKQGAATITSAMIPALNALAMAEGRVSIAIDKNIGKVKTSMEEFVEKTNEAFDKYGQAASTAFSYVDQLVNQSFQNKSIKMENDYKRQLEYINNSKMSEAEKAAALALLDEEYEGKRRDLAQKQAKSQKTLSAANALISTFEAAARAFTAGPIIGPILSGIIMGLGLALVAKIKNAPVPLARGAIFNQPTLLSGGDGRGYQVAESGSGGVEIVATPENIRKAIYGGRERGDGKPISLKNYVTIYLDGRMMKQFIVNTIEQQGQIGKLRLASKAVS